MNGLICTSGINFNLKTRWKYSFCVQQQLSESLIYVERYMEMRVHVVLLFFDFFLCFSCFGRIGCQCQGAMCSLYSVLYTRYYMCGMFDDDASVFFSSVLRTTQGYDICKHIITIGRTSLWPLFLSVRVIKQRVFYVFRCVSFSGALSGFFTHAIDRIIIHSIKSSNIYFSVNDYPNANKTEGKMVIIPILSNFIRISFWISFWIFLLDLGLFIFLFVSFYQRLKDNATEYKYTKRNAKHTHQTVWHRF